MNAERFAELLAEYALAHPTRELATVTALEFAMWQANRVHDPDSQCPEHGCARWRCQESHR